MITQQILDERLYRDLRTLYKRLNDEGKLIVGEKLQAYYEAFRAKFGPDQLLALDGEELLQTMHGPGWDVRTGERLLYRPDFCPSLYHPGAKQFLHIGTNGTFVIGTLREMPDRIDEAC